MQRPQLTILAALVVAAALAAAWLATRNTVGHAPDAALPAADADMLARLQALGYADWAEVDPEAARKRGVTVSEPTRFHPGLNLYNSRSRPTAHLVDMRGEEIHSWGFPTAQGNFHHVELAPGGDLVAIVKGRRLSRLDWDSKLLWSLEMDMHHDIALDAAGQIYALTSEAIEVPYRGDRIPIVDNLIAVISPDGDVLRRISLHALLGDEIPRARLDDVFRRSRGFQYSLRRLRGKIALADSGSDVMHTNSIEILARDVPGLGSRGDALISVRDLDLIVVVDLVGPRVVWRWGPGELDAQHQPSVLRNGNVLVFDNGARRGWSRVIEVEPATGRIVWEYSGEPPHSLFSRRKGGCEGLPNGNVLVTESERGRVVEVTRDGDTVWEFHSPDLDSSRTRRRSIYRMTRVDPARVQRPAGG